MVAVKAQSIEIRREILLVLWPDKIYYINGGIGLNGLGVKITGLETHPKDGIMAGCLPDLLRLSRVDFQRAPVPLVHAHRFDIVEPVRCSAHKKRDLRRIG